MVQLKFLLLVAALGLSELSLRIATQRSGHVEHFLGKPWYYLVPLGVPEEMPTVAPLPDAYRRYDPDLGWSINPLGREEPLYFADPRGIRCSEETHARALSGDWAPDESAAYDVITIGNSFTHGDEVRFEDSWPALLREEAGVRVLNLGVGGYGVDQAFLRFEKNEYRANLLLLGLIPGDLERARTQVYNLTVGGLKTKPMFLFEGFGSTIVNRPAIHGHELRSEFQLGVRSPFFRREPRFDPAWFERGALDFLYLYRVPRSIMVSNRLREPPIYRTPGEAFEYSMQIVTYGKRMAEERGGKLVLVLLGGGNTFSDYRGDEDPWRLLKQRLAQEGIEFIDTSAVLLPLYRQHPNRVLNPGGVHYTAEANHLVARTVAGWLSPERAEKAGPRGAPLAESK